MNTFEVNQCTLHGENGFTCENHCVCTTLFGIVGCTWYLVSASISSAHFAVLLLMHGYSIKGWIIINPVHLFQLFTFHNLFISIFFPDFLATIFFNSKVCSVYFQLIQLLQPEILVNWTKIWFLFINTSKLSLLKLDLWIHFNRVAVGLRLKKKINFVLVQENRTTWIGKNAHAIAVKCPMETFRMFLA